jgi:hypothetical protein
LAHGIALSEGERVMETFAVFLDDKSMCIIEADHFDITHGLLQFYKKTGGGRVMLSFFKMKGVKYCIHQKSCSRDEVLSQIYPPRKK